MAMKTFRYHMIDNEIIKINLKTNKGKVGYTIKKFQLMFANVENSIKAVVKIN